MINIIFFSILFVDHLFGQFKRVEFGDKKGGKSQSDYHTYDLNLLNLKGLVQESSR